MKNPLLLVSSFSVLVVGLSVAYYYTIALPKIQAEKQYVASYITEISPTETPTTVPTPETAPTNTPISATTSDNKQKANGCDQVVRDLFIQLNDDFYKVDDILLANNMECHYYLQRLFGLNVNDGHIRDQSEAINKRLNELLPKTNQNQTTTNNYQEEYNQKCIEDTTKYNLCMNEYNQKLSEHNYCVANSNFGCLKPFNNCFKPVCAVTW